MLTGYRIILVEFQFASRRALVLGGRVEVTRTSSRLQLDLFASSLCDGEPPN